MYGSNRTFLTETVRREPSLEQEAQARENNFTSTIIAQTVRTGSQEDWQSMFLH